MKVSDRRLRRLQDGRDVQDGVISRLGVVLLNRRYRAVLVVRYAELLDEFPAQLLEVGETGRPRGPGTQDQRPVPVKPLGLRQSSGNAFRLGARPSPRL